MRKELSDVKSVSNERERNTGIAAANDHGLLCFPACFAIMEARMVDTASEDFFSFEMRYVWLPSIQGAIE